METIQTLSTKILAEGSLRIQGLLKKREETSKEFLRTLFKKWNSELNTLNVPNGTVQTVPNKRRSLGDIFRIVRYYYPRTSLKTVINVIYDDLFDSVPKFRSSYCSTINKRVFYKGGTNQESHIYDQNTKDEYGLTIQEWKDL